MALRGLQTLAVVTVALSIGAPASAAPGNGAAVITGSFSDSCREFAAHSSKAISHVVITYADGRVVKDESTTTPDFAIDGGPGDAITSATVKSGTTRKTFTCTQANAPPTALLEISTPDDSGCGLFMDSGLACLQWLPRGTWRSTADFPTAPGSSGSEEAGNLVWLCDIAFACSPTFELRGTGSSDPDGDIVSWSLDFGDGASASGSWSTDPPAAVAHTYGSGPFSSCSDLVHICVTLTVNDAAGQSDTDTITMVTVDITPD